MFWYVILDLNTRAIFLTLGDDKLSKSTVKGEEAHYQRTEFPLNGVPLGAFSLRLLNLVLNAIILKLGKVLMVSGHCVSDADGK